MSWCVRLILMIAMHKLLNLGTEFRGMKMTYLLLRMQAWWPHLDGRRRFLWKALNCSQRQSEVPRALSQHLMPKLSLQQSLSCLFFVDKWALLFTKITGKESGQASNPISVHFTSHQSHVTVKLTVVVLPIFTVRFSYPLSTKRIFTADDWFRAPL